MKRHHVDINNFNANIHHLWDKQWMLLTCGNYQAGDYNTMTVAWGSLGTMWNKPFAQVVVRPNRHTYTFMEKYDTFTLCAFPQRYRGDLRLLGTRSGRDGDKISATDLTIIPSKKVESPAFEEAELIIECRKIYWQDFKPEQFLKPFIEKCYPHKDYHRIYFGEVLFIEATESFDQPTSIKS